MKKFLGKIDNNECAANTGFDACFVPMLLHDTSVDTRLVDSCECGLNHAGADVLFSRK